MERMAQRTKQPEVLRELFEALGERSLCDCGVSGTARARGTFGDKLVRS